MQQNHMQKNKAVCFLFILFIFINCAQKKLEYSDVNSSENKIQQLVSTISINLNDSTVLQNFIVEQEIWDQYRDAHIETLFPESIDGIKMEWGSIVSYEIAQEIIRLNNERIKILELYLNRNKETGTDGKGCFKEYVKELQRIKK